MDAIQCMHYAGECVVHVVGYYRKGTPVIYKVTLVKVINGRILAGLPQKVKQVIDNSVPW